MPRRHEESVIDEGLNSTSIEEGRIINVNTRRWTVDVRTRETQRVFQDIQWSSPYLHFTGGEGILFMPEVGAKVKVCEPGESSAFVMCFVASHERPARRAEAGEDSSVGDNPSDPAAEEGGGDVTYRAGRPQLEQGDIMLRTRDGNSIWLRRGGVLEIGSTAISKRLYIPLLNYIRDICENYSLWTAGGQMAWTVARSDESAAGEATAVLTIVGRNAAQDEKATVAVQIGHVDDTKRLRLIIAPNAINTETLEVTGTAVYTLDIDEEGTITSEAQKDHNHKVEGVLDWEVTGEATYRYQGGLTEEINGDQNTTVSGSHTLDAADSTERISGAKVIQAGYTSIGAAGGTTAVVLASMAMVGYMVGHVHPIVGSSTGPPEPKLPPSAFTATKLGAL